MAYDPSNVPLTTMKETLLHDDHCGNISDYIKITVYDPDNITKTTIKELYIENNRVGNINSLQENGLSYLVNEQYVPTTIRETLDNIDTNINCQVTIKKQLVYDPDQIAKKTIRETTTYETIGNVGKNGGSAGGTGYTILNTRAKNTNRQTTQGEYIGVCISNYKKYIQNKQNIRINKRKEKTLIGRVPTPNSVKILNSEINIRIKKNENDYINKRVPTIGKSIKMDNLPQEKGHNKKNIDNYEMMKDRISSYVVNQLESNPYALQRY